MTQEELKAQLAKEMSGDSQAAIQNLATMIAISEEKKRQLADEKKTVERGLDELRASMISLMTGNGMESVSFDGVGSFRVKIENFASITKEHRDSAHAILRRLDMEDLIQEMVNANTFKKWFNEENDRRMEAGEPALKDEFGECVSLFEKPTIRFTRPRAKK